MKQLVLLMLFSVSTLGIQGQNFDQTKMDAFFDRIAENDKGMGSLSIFQDGKEQYQRTFGMADIDRDVLASAKTKYRIGSISKTFTATIIMQMIEEGKLKLDQKLADFFPEVPQADLITIEHLLRHRSGLFNFTSADDYLEWMTQPHTTAQMMEKIINNGSVFTPDTQTEYSNTNYILLSWIAEAVDKKDFAAILQDRITKPLELNDTYYGGPIGQQDHEAHSYHKTDSWEKEAETDMSIPLGAGALVSTPTDLNRFFTTLFQGQLLKETSLNEMKTMQDGLGLGLFQFPFYDKFAYGHNGGIDGFQSMSGYFPDDKVAISYVSNGVVIPVNDVMLGALSIYFGKDFTLPDFAPSIALSSEQLEPLLGVYSSTAMPLKITITKDGNQLIGQATGQSSFRLEAIEPHLFRFYPSQLELEFNAAQETMILRQGGQQFEFTKEN